eukprot:3470047-Pyramimonas_sp.AAC.1
MHERRLALREVRRGAPRGGARWSRRDRSRRLAGHPDRGATCTCEDHRGVPVIRRLGLRGGGGTCALRRI